MTASSTNIRATCSLTATLFPSSSTLYDYKSWALLCVVAESKGERSPSKKFLTHCTKLLLRLFFFNSVSLFLTTPFTTSAHVTEPSFLFCTVALSQRPFAQSTVLYADCLAFPTSVMLLLDHEIQDANDGGWTTVPTKRKNTLKNSPNKRNEG